MRFFWGKSVKNEKTYINVCVVIYDCDILGKIFLRRKNAYEKCQNNHKFGNDGDYGYDSFGCAFDVGQRR